MCAQPPLEPVRRHVEAVGAGGDRLNLLRQRERLAGKRTAIHTEEHERGNVCRALIAIDEGLVL